MTRNEWRKRSGALRHLLRSLAMSSGRRELTYRFGAVRHHESGLWHIYNIGSRNCIATVRLLPQNGNVVKAVIRYRQSSRYALILQNFNYRDIETVHVPSLGLARRREWVDAELRQRVERQTEQLRQATNVGAAVDRTRIQDLQNTASATWARETLIVPPNMADMLNSSVSLGGHYVVRRPLGSQAREPRRDRRGRFISETEWARRQEQSRQDTATIPADTYVPSNSARAFGIVDTIAAEDLTDDSPF
jgi:hypothetical protein